MRELEKKREKKNNASSYMYIKYLNSRYVFLYKILKLLNHHKF